MSIVNSIFRGFVSALVLGSLFSVEAAGPMPVYHTPFKAETVSEGKKTAPVFDAGNKTFKFGSKEMIFADNGTFKVMSSGRCIASGSFFISTAFQSSQNNSSAKMKPGPWKDGTLYVESCKTDPAAKTITVEGKLPFHKKNTPVLLGSWKQTAALTPDGKVDIILDFELPEGQSPDRVKGFNLNFPTASGFTYGKKSEFRAFSAEKPVSSHTGPALLPKYANETDNCAWEFPEAKTAYLFHHRPGRDGIYFTPHPKYKTCRFHVRFDPLQYGKAAKTVPGKVDFKLTDRLDIPHRGKRNLLLNPYFGQKYAFFHSASRYYRGRGDITGEDALFGKYSFKSTGHNGYLQLSPVPADPGDYTFSFYARGSGRVISMFWWSGIYWRDPRVTKAYKIDSREWKRYSYTIRRQVSDIISVWLVVTPDKGKTVFIDGLQLEAGKTATDFEAPSITGAFLSQEENFFESGKPVRGELELSTLKPQVKGTASVSVKNFFDERIREFKFPFETGKGRYPAQKIDLGRLPDGIYVMTVDYALSDGLKSREHFRFSVMPYLKDDYPTRRIFSPAYSLTPLQNVTPDLYRSYRDYYKRLLYIGCGASCQPHTRIPPDLAKIQDECYQRRIGRIGPAQISAPQMRKTFPELKDKIKDGEVYFGFVDFRSYSDIRPILADYTLLNGWTPEYREKFKQLIAEQIRREPEWYCYGFASEWSYSIRNRKEYPDMLNAFTEAVRSVRPDARIMNMGGCNMDVRDTTLWLDNFYTRMKKEFPDWKPDFVETHPYTKDLTKLYPNFLAFKRMADRHFGRPRLCFTEGGHFYPYAVPAWDLPLVGWQPPTWNAGTLSYDLGWSEKLSAAYYARYYLIFLTEFDRVAGVCCSAEPANNFQLDISGTPRAFQKIPNTLGILFRNPKKYLGDFAPDREIRCFVWIDGEDRPLAAVWSENREINAGRGNAVDAALAYPGLELIDLMGNSHSSADNCFQITPFPLFLRGRKGDTENFLKALKTINITGSKNLPFQIADNITSDGRLQLTFKNILPREVKAKVKVGGKDFELSLPVFGSKSITVDLPQRLSFNQVKTFSVPLVCEVDGRKMTKTVESHAFACKRFTGSWKDVPVMQFPHGIKKYPMKNPEKCGYEGDFAAAFQVAWEPKGLHLRVTVVDDCLTGSDQNAYRWNYDVCQVYFDTRCSARAYGRTNYDEDDYDYGLMPSADGKRCDVWRAVSADMQLGLGTAAPPNKCMAKEIPATFTKTADGYIYEAFFPAPYLLPAKMEAGWNMGFGMLVGDRDRGASVKQALLLITKKDGTCYQSPHLWPLLVLSGDSK